MTIIQRILLNAFCACSSVLIVDAIFKPPQWTLLVGGGMAFTFLTVEDFILGKWGKLWKK